MSFKKLAKEVTVEVGKDNSKMTFKPLGSEALQSLLDNVNLEDIQSTKVSSITPILAKHIISLEGIEGEITQEFLLKDFGLVDLLSCAAALVVGNSVSEDQAKNSDSPLASQSAADHTATTAE